MTSAEYIHCNPTALYEAVGESNELFLELAEIFLRETLAKYETIKAAALAQDLNALRQESHALKGTIGPLEANELFKMVASIETECRQGSCDCPPERVAALYQEMQAARSEVERFSACLS